MWLNLRRCPRPARTPVRTASSGRERRSSGAQPTPQHLSLSFAIFGSASLGHVELACQPCCTPNEAGRSGRAHAACQATDRRTGHTQSMWTRRLTAPPVKSHSAPPRRRHRPQTRRRRENDAPSFDKLRQLRKNMDTGRLLLEVVLRRERRKKEMVQCEIDAQILEARAPSLRRYLNRGPTAGCQDALSARLIREVQLKSSHFWLEVTGPNLQHRDPYDRVHPVCLVFGPSTSAKLCSAHDVC